MASYPKKGDRVTVVGTGHVVYRCLVIRQRAQRKFQVRVAADQGGTTMWQRGWCAPDGKERFGRGAGKRSRRSHLNRSSLWRTRDEDPASCAQQVRLAGQAAGR